MTTAARNPVLARLRFLGTLMLGAYLLINALLLALTPLTSGWPTWSVTALAVPPMVLGMVYLVMPLARRGMPGTAPSASGEKGIRP